MEEQNNLNKELDDLKVKHAGYEKGKSTIMRVALVVLLCLVFAAITIFVYERIKSNVDTGINASQQNANEQELNKDISNANTKVESPQNSQTVNGQTQNNNMSSSNNNTVVTVKTNKETIVDYGYQPKSFVDFVIDSMKVYASMNILLNSPDGDVTASKILPEEITNNETTYREKIYGYLEDKNIVTKIYKDGVQLKCIYNESELLSKLGVSSHMGVGLLSNASNKSGDSILTYTFKDKFINSSFPYMDYFVGDYNETDLTKKFYSNDNMTMAILLSDVSTIQSDMTMQIAKITSSNKEEIQFLGAGVNLSVYGAEVQSVGRDLKSIAAIGKTTGNIYTFNTSNFAKVINKDNNFIFVIDGSGKVSCYVLTQGATSNNPTAINIETDSIG